MTWKLKRVKQCVKCPWKVSTDPHDIPNGYSEDLHQALAGTIAEPGSLCDTGHVMACHEHPPGDEAHCVGWLMHQAGPGNNIPLRLKLRSSENLDAVVLDGPQHERFEDTLQRRKPVADERDDAWRGRIRPFAETEGSSQSAQAFAQG